MIITFQEQMKRELTELREELSLLSSTTVAKSTAERWVTEAASAKIELVGCHKLLRRLDEKRMPSSITWEGDCVFLRLLSKKSVCHLRQYGRKAVLLGPCGLRETFAMYHGILYLSVQGSVLLSTEQYRIFKTNCLFENIVPIHIRSLL